MDLKAYPNLEAILDGTIAGNFRDWSAVRPELIKLVAEVEQLGANELAFQKTQCPNWGVFGVLCSGLEGCALCIEFKGKMFPTHDGSKYCESGSIASGGKTSHCSCDWCF